LALTDGEITRRYRVAAEQPGNSPTSVDELLGPANEVISQRALVNDNGM
jgi:hypothetical protein